MIPADQAKLNIYDTGVILGATVTEMARTFNHRLFRLRDHLDRLARSLDCIGLDPGVSLDDLGRIAGELVEHNARLIDSGSDLGLVAFITAGEAPMYRAEPGLPLRTKPTVCVQTFPLPFEVWADRMRDGAHLVTPSIRHIPPQCIPANMKHRSRMHYYLAEQEAHTVEAGAVPLLLDLDGHVAETNTANILIVEGGAIVSPTLKNILPGISREMIVELAARLEIPFAERELEPSDVARADEVLLASTPFCVMAAVRFNGQPIGDGRPGPIFRRLIEAWSEAVDLDVYRQIVPGA
jgi:branched-subunit amino acid aminotransferase/4-amino-4-deoxychorismate lyase